MDIEFGAKYKINIFKYFNFIFLMINNLIRRIFLTYLRINIIFYYD